MQDNDNKNIKQERKIKKNKKKEERKNSYIFIIQKFTRCKVPFELN